MVQHCTFRVVTEIEFQKPRGKEPISNAGRSYIDVKLLPPVVASKLQYYIVAALGFTLIEIHQRRTPLSPLVLFFAAAPKCKLLSASLPRDRLLQLSATPSIRFAHGRRSPLPLGFDHHPPLLVPAAVLCRALRG